MLGLLLMTGTSLYAQDNKDKEADRKAQEEKELQAKKEMLEMQRQEMKEQEARMKEQEIEFAEQAEVMRVRARETARASARETARVFVSSGEEGDYSYFYSPEERGTRSQLTLRNTFNGGSDTSSGEFDVDENVRQFRCNIRGKVREGEILIKVFYPGGKVFKELTINSSAEVSFTQSLSFGDDSKDKYLGSWSYEVEAKKAKGDYFLSITSE